MGTSGVGFSNLPHDFPPKCRHFGHPSAIILHLFGLKTVETLTLNSVLSLFSKPYLTPYIAHDAVISGHTTPKLPLRQP
jgi:hypothetical protein